VTSHAREYGKRRFVTKPEHMPASHRAHLEWTPSKLIAWGRSVGPPVGELVERILNTRPHPEHGYRACMGLKRLFKRYGPDRLTAACQRALASGGISYTSVDAILKNGLDRSPLLVDAAPKIIAMSMPTCVARRTTSSSCWRPEPVMLMNQTLDKLDALGLFGMAMSLREQLESTQYATLSFEERLGVLVDREAEARDSRRLTLRLKAAKLRQEATIEDIDFRTPRGLDRSVIMTLAQAGWVNAKHNVLITGPTGAGKSFVACALTHAAVRRGHTALYVRTPRLLTELALSRGDGRYVRRLATLAKIGVLVLDDFCLTPPSIIEAKDLLEVIDDRSQVRSTVVVSQLPVENWHTALAAGDPTLADAIVDRLVNNAHRLALKGNSMRRRHPEEPPSAA